MDIQEIRGSDSELSHVPPESTISCPGCAAEVVSGDRFCQECGTRISINRARAKGYRDKRSSPYTEGIASVICINCGTTNQALSKVCSDCKIPLVIESLNAGSAQGGLRGSIANKSKPSFSKAVRGGKPEPELHLENNRSTSSPPERKETDSAISNGIDPNSGRASQTNKVFVGTGRTYGTVFKKATEPNQEALDYLFSANSKNRASILGSFEKLINESRNIRNVFSLSGLVVLVEGLFDMVPTPLIFLVTSLAIVIATVNATTQWNRHEQRLQALDKIAANAEENMRRYELDIAIRTLRELERTEKGDLPPRPRAVLNQCLWLRSYKLAKEKQYGRALKDLSRVTPEFVSYDDVREKKADFEKLLASHPEFSGDLKHDSTTNKEQASANSSSESQPAIDERPPGSSPLKPSLSRTLLAARVESKSNNRRISPNGDVNLTPKTAGQVVKSPPAEDEPAPAASDKKTARKASKGNLPDHDMKRYSGLLVDYFSRAEAERTEGDKISEPPSFDEWVRNGKGDF